MKNKVLKLSQSYEPVSIVGWKKAFKLISLGKAEVIREYENEIRTGSSVFKFPAVIRLTKSFPRFKSYIRFSKQNIFARDRWQCAYCKKKLPSSELTVDHVLPKSRGGQSDWKNLVTCCKSCNFKKKDNTPQEVGMTLYITPTIPDYIPPFSFNLFKSETPEIWKDFYFFK